MSLKNIFISILLLMGCHLHSQVNYNDTISKKAFDTLVQNSFTRILTSNSAPTNYSNYASFDPTDLNFVFNSFSKFTPRTSANLTFKGSLLDDKISTVLFSDGTVNKNTSIGLKFNVRTDQMFLTIDRKDFIKARNKIETLERQYKNDSTLTIYKIEMAPITLELIILKIRVLKDSLGKLDTAIMHSTIDLVNCGHEDEKCYLKATNELIKFYSTKSNVIIDTMKLSIQKDSVKLILFYDRLNISDSEYISLGGSKFNYRANILKQIREMYDNKRFEIEKNIKIPVINYTWVSVIGDLHDQTFKVFDSSLIFNEQLASRNLTTCSFGAEFTWIYIDSLFRKNFLLNSGIKYKMSNNLDDLTTSTMSKEITFTSDNKMNTIKKDYSVYTDSIKEFNALEFYINFYKLLGRSQLNAFHLNPSVEFRDSNINIYNFLTGYIHSFSNAKTGAGMINVELYVKFIDLTNSLDSENELEQRIQIGVTFGVPFNLNLSTINGKK